MLTEPDQGAVRVPVRWTLRVMPQVLALEKVAPVTSMMYCE